MTPHMQTDKPVKNKMWDLFLFFFFKVDACRQIILPEQPPELED